jgi:hypothetical protein
MRCEGNKFYSIAQFINKTIAFNIYRLMSNALSNIVILSVISTLTYFRVI